MTAIVILSGGMDSTAALCKTVAEEGPNNVESISFDYGQRHRVELECANVIASNLQVPNYRIDLRSVNTLFAGAGSALVDKTVDVPEGHYEEESMKATVVPNRNAMMLNIAIARAVAIGANRVVTGVHAGDHAVYPDCRPEFIEQVERLAHIANEGFIEPDFIIDAPFRHDSKAAIVQIGETFNAPWADTWTCYKGNDMHCGRCSTCVERLEAFDIAGVEDPVVYQDRDYWREVINGG